MAHLLPLSLKRAYDGSSNHAFILLRNNPLPAANDLFCRNESTLKGIYLGLCSIHSY